jgi:DNA replication protein DnaC
MEKDYSKELRGVVEMTPWQVAEIRELKKRIMAQEGGAGEKEKEFQWQVRLLASNMPHIYWGLELKDFGGDIKSATIVQKYIGIMKEAYEAGQGILFLGRHGTGKTMLACIIGKEAMRKGYTVYYIGIPSLIDGIMSGFRNEEAKERLSTIVTRTEFLIIDDLGKEYRGIGQKLDPLVMLEMDRILRERINRGKVTIATTNYDMKAVTKAYGDSVLSVLRGYVQFIEVSGEDFRGYLGDKFKERLEKK